jgi:hypothetical protein
VEDRLPTPSLLLAAEDVSPIAQSHQDSTSTLAIGHLDLSNTTLSPSWENLANFHVDDIIPMDTPSPQDLESFSTVLPSPVVLDLPTPGISSAESSYDNIDHNPNGDSANITTSREPEMATSSSGASDPEQRAEPVNWSNSRKRKVSATGESPKRSRPQQKQTPQNENRRLQVARYIQKEKDKCATQGVEFNDRNYLPPNVVRCINELDKDGERAAMSMIFTAIGSSETIAHLQHIICQSKSREQRIGLAGNLSRAQRFQEIQQLDGQIAFSEFLKRCHVWKLYKDTSRDFPSPESGFVIVNAESINNLQTRRSGNPNIIRASEITKSMFRELAPELEPGCQEYEKKYQYYTKLRRLGQKLDILTETFGLGFLGLIPSRDPFESIDFDETWVSFSRTRTL